MTNRPARNGSAAGHAKTPAITLGFWIIKIAATTLGETGGDALSMGLDLGYALSSAIFLGGFVALAAAQIGARRFHPWLYWLVIVGTTLAGTTMADFADRSLGAGYPGGALTLLALVLACLALWWRVEGDVRVDDITRPRTEAFYWATILASNTLGTALGDWAADGGLGFAGGALVFALALAVVAAAWWRGLVSGTLAFWLGFVLTRPLGATLGDTLTKPIAEGGLELGRLAASAAIALFIVACLLALPQRAGGAVRSGAPPAAARRTPPPG